jgi:hypothetical protein
MHEVRDQCNMIIQGLFAVRGMRLCIMQISTKHCKYHLLHTEVLCECDSVTGRETVTVVLLALPVGQALMYLYGLIWVAVEILHSHMRRGTMYAPCSCPG